MKSRLEPLLWLQCLALGAIPLELLLIRLILAGADPGPVPPVERLLIWAIGVLAPAAALWKRPADWGSLLLVRVPLKERDQAQQALSAKQGGLISRTSVVVAALGSLPLLWWLDDSAVLASEFSPVLGQSRLVTLLISIPVLALMVWQVQQLSQALGWLLPVRSQLDQAASAENTVEYNSIAADQQHTSFGLQILRLNRLAWPEPAVKPTPQPPQPSEPLSTEPVPEESKKVGRPKKEKKPRTAKQLANDERQRQRFKQEHEARKKKGAESKPEEPKAEPKSPVPEPVPEEPEQESEPEEETVYIKRKPRKKTKRTYVIEPSSSDESSEDERPKRGYQRRVPQPRFSQEAEPFTLTFK